jgi:hypothetical protein
MGAGDCGDDKVLALKIPAIRQPCGQRAPEVARCYDGNGLACLQCTRGLHQQRYSAFATGVPRRTLAEQPE